MAGRLPDGTGGTAEDPFDLEARVRASLPDPLSISPSPVWCCGRDHPVDTCIFAAELASIAREVRQALPSRSLFMSRKLGDENTAQVVLAAGVPVPGFVAGTTYNTLRTPTDEVMHTGEPFIVNRGNLIEAVLKYPHLGTYLSAGAVCRVTVAVRWEGRITGTLSVLHSNPDIYNAGTAALLEPFAARAGRVLGTSRLPEERETAPKPGMAWHRKAERLAEGVRKVLPYDRLVITLISLEAGYSGNIFVVGQDIPTMGTGNRMPLTGSVTRLVALSGRPLIISTRNAPTYAVIAPASKLMQTVGLPSALFLPLLETGRCIANLTIRSRVPDSYKEAHIPLLERFAPEALALVHEWTGLTGLRPALDRAAWGDIELDNATCQAIRGGEIVRLTPGEFALLGALVRAKGGLVGYRELARSIPSRTAIDGTGEIHVFVHRLRQKLRALRAETVIITVRGRGLRLQ